MPSEARQKKIMEKLNRAQKCSILGPQNLGSRGGPGPRGPPLDPHLLNELALPYCHFHSSCSINHCLMYRMTSIQFRSKVCDNDTTMLLTIILGSNDWPLFQGTLDKFNFLQQPSNELCQNLCPFD